ncbi:hypothetical protein YB2330_005021 [Saitoella coloradoensis]
MAFPPGPPGSTPSTPARRPTMNARMTVTSSPAGPTTGTGAPPLLEAYSFARRPNRCTNLHQSTTIESSPVTPATSDRPEFSFLNSGTFGSPTRFRSMDLDDDSEEDSESDEEEDHDPAAQGNVPVEMRVRSKSFSSQKGESPRVDREKLRGLVSGNGTPVKIEKSVPYSLRSEPLQRVFMRRSNLLPKPKSLSRVAASLADETHPFDFEVKREAALTNMLSKEPTTDSDVSVDPVDELLDAESWSMRDDDSASVSASGSVRDKWHRSEMDDESMADDVPTPSNTESSCGTPLENPNNRPTTPYFPWAQPPSSMPTSSTPISLSCQQSENTPMVNCGPLASSPASSGPFFPPSLPRRKRKSMHEDTRFEPYGNMKRRAVSPGLNGSGSSGPGGPIKAESPVQKKTQQVGGIGDTNEGIMRMSLF